MIIHREAARCAAKKPTAATHSEDDSNNIGNLLPDGMPDGARLARGHHIATAALQAGRSFRLGQTGISDI